jgi:hypothetical protein
MIAPYFPVVLSFGLLPSIEPEPLSVVIPSPEAFFIRSASSEFASLLFASLSSSLSPRLKGSLSTIGDGSTVDRGCHLLNLLPTEEVRLIGSGVS